MKKRLIKKKVKQMSNSDLNDCVVYETNKHWRYYAEKEFYIRNQNQGNDFWDFWFND